MPVKSNWANGEQYNASDQNEIAQIVNTLEASSGLTQSFSSVSSSTVLGNSANTEYLTVTDIPVAVSGDPWYNNVFALLKFEAANNSTVLSDSSYHGANWSVSSGTPKISTAQSRWGNSSLLLAGGDCISAPSTLTTLADSGLGRTFIEMWFRPTSLPGAGQTATIFDVPGGLRLFLSNDGTSTTVNMQISYATPWNFTNTASVAISADTWYYLGYSLDITTHTLIVNSTTQVSTGSAPNDIGGTAAPLLGSATSGFAGYIDDFRLQKNNTVAATSTPSGVPPTGPSARTIAQPAATWDTSGGYGYLRLPAASATSNKYTLWNRSTTSQPLYVYGGGSRFTFYGTTALSRNVSIVYPGQQLVYRSNGTQWIAYYDEAGAIDAYTGTTPTQAFLNASRSFTTVGSTTPTASTAVQWDSNLLIRAKNYITTSSASTVTSGGSTTIMATGDRSQIFTGTSNHTVVMNSSGTFPGTHYVIANESTGVLTINASGGTTITTVPAGGTCVIFARTSQPAVNTGWAFYTHGTFPTGQVADLSIVAFGANTTRAAGTGDFPFGTRLQRAVTFTSVTYRAATADASGNLVVELRKNGVALSGSSATIAAASQVSGGTATGTWAFAAGDVITVQVTGVGTTPGKGLIADVRGLTT